MAAGGPVRQHRLRYPETATRHSSAAPGTPATEPGAAWVFSRSGSAWSQQGSKLTPSDEDNTGGGGGFGSAAALSSNGNTALVTAQFDAANSAGAAWLFQRSGSSWSTGRHFLKFAPNDEDNSAGGGTFGFSAALSADGRTSLLGGPGDGVRASGAAWVFVATAPGAATGDVQAIGGNAQATASFTPPASRRRLSVITSYTVAANPGGAHTSGSSSPITVTGLTSGQSYTFTVTATNAVGTGPASPAMSECSHPGSRSPSQAHRPARRRWRGRSSGSQLQRSSVKRRCHDHLVHAVTASPRRAVRDRSEQSDHGHPA